MICINAVHCTQYLFTELIQGKSSWDIVGERVQALRHESEKVLVLAPEGLFPTAPTGCIIEERNDWTPTSFFRSLASHSSGVESTEILIVHADAPFLSTSVADQLRHIHREFHVQYSFADGYPEGVAAEIIDSRILSALESLSAELPLQRNFLFDTIAKDINSFDVETELAPKDYRDLRLSLYCDGRRTTELCRRLVQHGALDSDERLLDLLDRKRELTRVAPSFAAVEVSTRYAQRPQYLPQYAVPSGEEFMERSTFDKLCGAMVAFSPEITLSISVPGEIALHPDPVGIITTAQERGIRRILLETSGVGWSSVTPQQLYHAAPDIDIIIDVDTLDPALYERMRGPGYSEARNFAEGILELYGARCYIASTRSQLNEFELDDFYKHWKASGAQVLIRKYDHYCGRLPDLRVTDLSPLQRHACRHLERDITIMVDGTLSMCLEDIERRTALGNVFTDGFETAWEAGSELYLAQLAGRYDGICGACDEYYTFNF